jgi:hypothetical protein
MKRKCNFVVCQRSCYIAISKTIWHGLCFVSSIVWCARWLFVLLILVRRKPTTCHKLLTNFAHDVVTSTSMYKLPSSPIANCLSKIINQVNVLCSYKAAFLENKPYRWRLLKIHNLVWYTNSKNRGRRGRDRLVIGFTTTCATLNLRVPKFVSD